MKSLKIVLFMFCVLPISLFAQQAGICDYTTSGWLPVTYDSIDFSTYAGNISYQIDTTQANNIWQLGTVSKSGFTNSIFGGKGLQTDTLNPYPANNISSFEVWSSTFTSQNAYSIAFWHAYDVDSLLDTCKVQYSTDSGTTWLDYNAQGAGFMINYDYDTDSLHEPSSSGKFIWSGNSGGWKKAKICFTYFTIGPNSKMPQNAGFRFAFISDSIHTNKDGWAIDKIRMKNAAIVGSVHDVQKNALLVYPNPSSDGLFTIDFPSNYVTGRFMVYDYLGRQIQNIALKEKIDLSKLQQGIYFYKTHFEQSNQWFSGTLNIR